LIAGGAVFTWASKKQSMVAQSSTEAKYVALLTAAREDAYVRKLINELGFGNLQVQIYGDNQSAHCLVKNYTYHSRSKHIDHYVRELYKKKIIEIKYVPTENMISDVLIKNLNRVKHERCIRIGGVLY